LRQQPIETIDNGMRDTIHLFVVGAFLDIV
jgi:hypothetical protein